jgi:uncharacterized membrane protein (Fun14 family)
VGGGFFGGILLGYALKKVVKLIAIVVDEIVVISKDCSRIGFNMEAWLNAPSS